MKDSLCISHCRFLDLLLHNLLAPTVVPITDSPYYTNNHSIHTTLRALGMSPSKLQDNYRTTSLGIER